MTDAPAPLPFGPFMLERRIAVGGHAEVFLARPKAGTKPALELVIKRLLPAAREDAGFEALDREAQLNKCVSHPNVVEVYGAGMVGGEPYLAMEYVDGVDLYRLLRRMEGESLTMRPGLAVYIARQVAVALAAVHAACDGSGHALDIVHRDVTPSNVYLSIGGDVKLGDFGIARVSVDAPPMSAGGLKGKFGYFSPEQIEGEPADRRSDLFSLAAMLGEMLIGKRVFPGGGELAVLLAIRDANIESLERAAANLPQGLFAVCKRALSRSPNDRYANADELAAALLPYEVPDPSSLRTALADWVTRARDPGQLAEAIRGRVADSVARMRATRSSGTLAAARGVPAPSARNDAPAPSQADSTRERPSKVRRADGSVVEGISFAKLIEMIATGDLAGTDNVSLMGSDFCEIREIDELARHLMTSTTQTTGHLFELGSPDFADELAHTPLLRVLATLRRNHETGALFIQRRDTSGQQRKEVYLKSGRLLHVASTEREELLGQYLVRRGALSQSALESALQRLGKSGGRLGDTLIGMGVVSAVDMFRAIRDQGRDRVAAACAWNAGSVAFYRGSAPMSVDFPLDLDLASPMMAGALHQSRGDPRSLLPEDHAKLLRGKKCPAPGDRDELGTAPRALVLVTELAASTTTVRAMLDALTAQRGDARPIGEAEACASLLAATALEWIEMRD